MTYKCLDDCSQLHRLGNAAEIGCCSAYIAVLIYYLDPSLDLPSRFSPFPFPPMSSSSTPTPTLIRYSMFTFFSILVWLAGTNAHLSAFSKGMYCINVRYPFPICNFRFENLPFYNRVHKRVSIIRMRTRRFSLYLILTLISGGVSSFNITF